MYDFDSHARFMRSATDAWFNYATAAVAALGAWQNHISNQLETNPQSSAQSLASPYEQAFGWWTSMFFPQGQQPVAAKDFGAAFFQFSPLHTMHNGFNPGSMLNPFNAFGAAPSSMTNSWVSGWTEMMTAYSRTMPQFSWNVFQGPMTAWLMSAGLPYDVACATARGNTATMDAAVAARESMDKMYSSFRTDGGHAVAPMLQPMAMLLAPYWPASGNQLH